MNRLQLQCDDYFIFVNKFLSNKDCTLCHDRKKVQTIWSNKMTTPAVKKVDVA